MYIQVLLCRIQIIFLILAISMLVIVLRFCKVKNSSRVRVTLRQLSPYHLHLWVQVYCRLLHC